MTVVGGGDGSEADARDCAVMSASIKNSVGGDASSWRNWLARDTRRAFKEQDQTGSKAALDGHGVLGIVIDPPQGAPVAG